MSRVLANGKPAKKIVFFEKGFEIPDYDNPKEVSRTRWRLIHTPWFGIYLHKWNKPDPRQTPHNHPWTFVSFILRGQYIEERIQPGWETGRTNVARWVNVVSRRAFHAVKQVVPGTISLMFVGKTHEDWGYCVFQGSNKDRGRRYVNFDKHPHSKEFSEAMKYRKILQQEGSI